jgi:hypothetical protein
LSVGIPVARKTTKKPEAAPSESRRFGTLVRLGEDVVADAKKVAALREMSMAEYLTELLRPIVKRDLEAEKRKL